MLFRSVVGEAMACGIPCVATDVGECAEVIGNTGRIVPKQDSPQLATAIVELLNLPSPARQELGQSARQRICERYDINRIVARYRELWMNLVGQQTVIDNIPLRRAA